MPEKEPQCFRREEVSEEAPKEAQKEKEMEPEEKAEVVKEERLKEIENEVEKIRREVGQWRDAEGMPVDEKIKEIVVILNALDISTSASCEGHIDKGKSAPWVEIAAPNKPGERFVGEKDIFQKVADKYGVSFEDVRRDIHHDAWVEAIIESSKTEETPEYKQWRKENKKLMRKVSKILNEFYQEKEVSDNLRLIISEGGEGEFRVHNGGKDYELDLEGLTEKQKEELGQRLSTYQKEMREFGEFLKEKYLKEE